jgi:hypothetical protein
MKQPPRWDYRVVRDASPNEEEIEFAIHEAHDYVDEIPQEITAKPVGPAGRSRDHIRQELQQMLLALDKPALRREEFREPYPKASRARRT